LVVSIDKKGVVYIGAGNKVGIQDLGKRLTGIIKARKDKRVFIRADKDVTYGKVMAVMGSIRRAGIFKVGLITEPS
jgi:biopolymer transport protein TolR